MMELMRFLKRTQHRKRRVTERILNPGSGKRKNLAGRLRRSQKGGMSGKAWLALTLTEANNNCIWPSWKYTTVWNVPWSSSTEGTQTPRYGNLKLTTVLTRTSLCNRRV